MKFAFYTLGCKVNLFETQALTQLVIKRGHEVVEKDADAVIVNTCTVTSSSDHKNIRAFHKLRKDNPNAIMAACGCFAEVEPEKVKAVEEIDLVCGTKNRADVIDKCEAQFYGNQMQQADLKDDFEILPAGVPLGRTRALLKIEDGCDNYCTYCIIPYARGHIRSMPVSNIKSEIERLQNCGVHEIVLTGIELSSYGKEFDVSLTDLLDEILAEFPSMRFRLGSLDPRTTDREFCDRLGQYKNLVQHFHLSLQSGCDTVLKRMGRRYQTETYYNNVKMLREAFPNCSITTDLIVGFPGETEEEFEQTLAFLNRCAFAAVHVFPYSKREGTVAAKMEHQIKQDIKKKRAQIAKSIAAPLSEMYRKSFVGKTLYVLPEQSTKNGYRVSHGNYSFPIYIKDTESEKNKPMYVDIIRVYQDGVLGKKTN